MFKHVVKNAVKQTPVVLTAALLTVVAAGCAKQSRQQPAAPAETAAADELDGAIRGASDYLNGNIPKGNKIVILNILSGSSSLSDYVIDELIANAVRDGLFTVVDRSQLDAIRDEQQFQMSGAVDDNDALAIGKFFGAQTIVSGTLSALGGGAYRITVRALDVQTAQVLGQYNRNIGSSPVVNSLMASGSPAGGATRQAQGAGQAQAALETKPVRQGTKGADFRDGKTGVEMVFVAGGTFAMGCTGDQINCGDDEKPARDVTLGDFYIGRYEVTQKQWKAVMGNNPSAFMGDSLPVDKVNWAEAQDFIAELNKLTGKKYRLPTEAEWEYAARGGNKSRGYRYSGSSIIDKVAWYKENSHVYEGYGSRGKTHPAGGKQPNELGICDMSGNVWEWVGDWSGSYESAGLANPAGPPSGSDRAIRGGGWGSEAQGCRVSVRGANAPDHRGGDLGFRLALDP